MLFIFKYFSCLIKHLSSFRAFPSQLQDLYSHAQFRCNKIWKENSESSRKASLENSRRTIRLSNSKRAMTWVLNTRAIPAPLTFSIVRPARTKLQASSRLKYKKKKDENYACSLVKNFYSTESGKKQKDPHIQRREELLFANVRSGNMYTLYSRRERKGGRIYRGEEVQKSRWT